MHNHKFILESVKRSSKRLGKNVSHLKRDSKMNELQLLLLNVIISKMQIKLKVFFFKCIMGLHSLDCVDNFLVMKKTHKVHERDL